MWVDLRKGLTLRGGRIFAHSFLVKIRNAKCFCYFFPSRDMLNLYFEWKDYSQHGMICCNFPESWWLTDKLTNGQTDTLTHWLTDTLTHWHTDSLTHWLTNLLTHILTDTDSLAHWLTDSLSHWLNDSLTHWHTDKQPDCLPHLIYAQLAK